MLRYLIYLNDFSVSNNESKLVALQAKYISKAKLLITIKCGYFPCSFVIPEYIVVGRSVSRMDRWMFGWLDGWIHLCNFPCVKHE